MVEFSPTKGVRQGDPLSPYLLLITVEVLNPMMIQVVYHGRDLLWDLGTWRTQETWQKYYEFSILHLGFKSTIAKTIFIVLLYI